ncbi:MAG TPA: hypothetical protein VNV66_22025, partial [Pilimelia sp.]|nr:hypothetical protein [Pilimelia sp.]
MTAYQQLSDASFLSLSTEGEITIQWRNERDMQDGLAELAHLCGWKVQRELHVLGWGRVDLV